jgi:hypothetical protein
MSISHKLKDLCALKVKKNIATLFVLRTAAGEPRAVAQAAYEAGALQSPAHVPCGLLER